MPSWADPLIAGTWLTEPRDGVAGLIEVQRCGDGFCGTVLYGIDGAGARVDTLAGRSVLRSMRRVEAGHYAGEVIDPRSGDVYLGRLTVAGDRLSLQGCVLGGLICATSHWRRP